MTNQVKAPALPDIKKYQFPPRLDQLAQDAAVTEAVRARDAQWVAVLAHAGVKAL